MVHRISHHFQGSSTPCFEGKSSWCCSIYIARAFSNIFYCSCPIHVQINVVCLNYVYFIFLVIDEVVLCMYACLNLDVRAPCLKEVLANKVGIV